MPLLVTTFLTVFLNVLSLQRKDASKAAGNCFQLLMVLFTKEYLAQILNSEQLKHYIPPPPQKNIFFGYIIVNILHKSDNDSNKINNNMYVFGH